MVNSTGHRGKKIYVTILTMAYRPTVLPRFFEGLQLVTPSFRGHGFESGSIKLYADWPAGQISVYCRYGAVATDLGKWFTLLFTVNSLVHALYLLPPPAHRNAVHGL